ncbi:RNA polymerase I-specific transcription initiation factor RRN3 [Lingula anatina]|uniref:RNA polymerase I-specific transcription initiation factor RRN3 n=1 Tax=Lingula anatina TaxID=7574 RepID=A0A1S3JXZ1_LINAN|nr:RNA polymerase I-specific transcription initiation factor RRN3 [Lingula anatina]|eukprot:XP_013415248.1 RNA polymerase I-specific transcription initiation factor RRN3 [Lingula anatina]
MDHTVVPQRSGVIDVQNILEKSRVGAGKEYDLLISHLTKADVEPALLLACLRGLRECVSILGKDFELLVGVIFSIEWTNKDVAIIQEYLSLVINLVSAHPFYLRSCLRSLVKQLIPKQPKQAKSELEKEILDGQKSADLEQMFINIHTLIKNIAQIVPMTPQVLMPLLVECFPYMTKDAFIQECYVENLLRIPTYLPVLRPKILELVVDKMLKFDVRSPRDEIIELEDNEEAMDTDVIFDMEDLPSILSGGKDTSSTQNEISAMTHKEANKLDILMHLMFRYIQNICYQNGELDWEATKKLYRELLQVFDRVIITTHASCHVQFLMFYMCSLKQALCDGFIDYLWKKVQNPNTEPVFRQAAVAYIASIMARGKFVAISTVMDCLKLICDWVHQYIDQTSDSIRQADVQHHGPFYSVCQAVFYVFVFRHKEMLELKKGYKFAESLNFQTIVTSRLNPLRVCLPVVAKTFTSVTRMHQLAFCDTIMERNNRSLLPVAALGLYGPSRLTHVNPLDSFFPFDPYLLNRSGQYVIPLYREYEDSPPEEEGRPELQSEEEDDFLPQVQSPSECVGSLSRQGKVPDFLHYGTSPGFKHIDHMI